MRVGLFVPCYVDQFYPQIGLATLEILERITGVEVIFPDQQTCCGQPMANTGCLEDTAPLAEKFVSLFSDFDHVVAPSGSCVSMVRNHYQGFFHHDARFDHLKTRVWELCEFLVDVVGVENLGPELFRNCFEHRVGLHSSCHGLRELRLGSSSERNEAPFSKVIAVLEKVPGVTLVELERGDECCGFGGTFAVAEEGVSVLMGMDRVEDHMRSGAEVMTATDASCLMHMEGLLRRRKLPLRTMHVAEIITGRELPIW